MELEILAQHWGTLKDSRILARNIEKFGKGELPHAATVMKEIFKGTSIGRS